jgi:hypothetical protein
MPVDRRNESRAPPDGNRGIGGKFRNFCHLVSLDMVRKRLAEREKPSAAFFRFFFALGKERMGRKRWDRSLDRFGMFHCIIGF